MKKRFLAPLAALLAGAGLAAAESPTAPNVLPSVRPVLVDQTILPSTPGAGCGAAADGSPGCSVIPAAPGCEACGPPGRFWFGAEYLIWWTKDGHTPPLVTTGSPATGGVAGPGTSVIYGGSPLDYDIHSGARFTAGLWLDDENTLGIEGSYFFLGSHSTNFTAGSSGADGSSLIARPFFNTATGAPDAELTAFPTLAAGTIQVHSQSEFQGAELNAVYNLCCGCDGRIDLLLGSRYLELREGLSITEIVDVAPTVPTLGGDHLVIVDNFSTRNQFYGSQVGVRGEWRSGRLFVDAVGKVALGYTHEEVEINGSTTIAAPGAAPRVVPGGLLALDGNSGHFSRDRFAVVPEGTLRVGYQVTDHLRASAGYTFLYWSDVVRPGDQIDPVLNPNKIPTSFTFGQPGGAARPAFSFHETDFWAQGINLGLELRY